MFSEILRRLRRIKNLSQADLAKEFGISQASIGEYEAGHKFPRMELFLQICTFFNVSPDYMLGFPSYAGNTKSIPILSIIHTGLPALAEENYSEQITISQFDKGVDFALRVTGDSMIYAGIYEGDIVLMRMADTADSGRIVAAVTQGTDCMVTLNYYVDGKAPVLRAANPKYPDQPITSNHRIIGVFAGLVRIEAPDMYEYQGLITYANGLDEEWREAMVEFTSAGLGPDEVRNLVNVLRMMKK